ncbi:hypothetical protein BRC78_05355 [Halobacteriales archaeon QH_8_68_33]|nr:MAG: hypothetical protein BRC78_05355 [Halobacteriales archaeon QH_8_68_33]
MLADRLGMPKSTVHAHLETLEEEGYLMNDEGSYRTSGSRRHSTGMVSRRLRRTRSPTAARSVRNSKRLT